MVQQRDGVQAGFEQELNEALEKQTQLVLQTQQLESQILQMRADHDAHLAQLQSAHDEDVKNREAAYVVGIRDMEGKVKALESERNQVCRLSESIHDIG